MILLADSEGPDVCADAQADPDLRCPHLPEDMFSSGTAQVMTRYQSIDESLHTKYGG